MNFPKIYMDNIRAAGKVSANTILAYGNVLERVFSTWSDNEKLTDEDFISEPQEVLRRYSEYLESINSTGNSIKQHITIIKMASKKVLNMKIEFTYQPTHQDRKRAARKKIERWFNEQEISMCLNYEFQDIKDEALRIRNRAMVRILVETGARIQEVCSITQQNIDLLTGTIKITKSKTLPRFVFISDITRNLLQEYFSLVSIGSDTIFPCTGTSKIIITSMLQALGLKNGSDGRGPHTFRHYCATYLYYTGKMDLADIAILLGDTPDIIRECYLHPTPAMLRERVAKAMGW